MIKNNEQQYVYYGTHASALEIEKFILHVVKVNEFAIKDNKKRKSVCIWGEHGIGKTELVEKLAKDNGMQFAYIAPAQFEEMGDLLGMPKIINDKTVFVPPAWVPTEDVPGILLLDDVNRADDRILRGIMQLLQNYELQSWKLPSKWTIVLTANPDGGDYSVTSMDDAMITRMLHVSMQFDVKAWAIWAEKSAVDERGINFVLTYPELISGGRTTPRSLVQFFDTISCIKDLKKEFALVQLLADSSLDPIASNAFIAFVHNNLSKLVSPEEILNAKNFDKEVKKPLEVLMQDHLRLDILATICTRLVNYLQIGEIKLSAAQVENSKKFLKLEVLPNDIRLSLVQDMIKHPLLKSIVADPYITELLLLNM
ncbi:AAA family ATPase [Flavobacterium adhaerens]|uniref:AAA family ATPase n=1 Tax=Flavobacterium adhaerens TaxID=3149043 RepID=UPI0032B49860